MNRDLINPIDPADIKPGQVVVGVLWRAPYSSVVGVVLVDAADIIAANTASTSALVGSTSRLRAIARAVRSRSYALIASVSSLFDARRRCSTCKRASNSSVESVMGALSAVEVVRDSHRKSGTGAHQHGHALPTVTAWLAGISLALVIGCSHYLDDIPDHSAEWDQAVDLQAAIVASIDQQKFDRAAQALCGSQAAWVQLPDGAVQCSTKHGKPTVTVRVSP